MLLILGYLASVLMGVVLGMIGGGGSILTVPILVYLFQLDPLTATAYSLFIVGVTALIGGFEAFRRGNVDLKTGLLFALPSFIGVYLARAYLLPALPQEIFEMGGLRMTKSLLVMLVFAVLMVVSSFSMMRKRVPREKVELSPQLKRLIIAAEGLIVGAVTGFVGAGGGFLIIPALVVLVGLPMKIAVGTSLFIITTKSLVGFTGDLQRGLVLDYGILLGASGLAAIGIIVGGLLSDKIPEPILKKGFGLFVLFTGALILLDQIRAL